MIHSDIYYIRKKEGEYEAKPHAKKLANKYGFDLFRADDRISCGKTGACVATGITDKAAIDSFKAKLDNEEMRSRLVNAITLAVERFGYSPRYTRPEERHDELFPPAEKALLAEMLYGGRHYFNIVDTVDGIPIYTKKEKNPSPPSASLYVQVDGYMVAYGHVGELDRLKQEPIREKIEGFRAKAKAVFEEAMADPGIWVDFGAARLLGRFEEAQQHNAPIREARKREELEAAEQRQHEEAEQQAEEQRQYEAAIAAAEEKIRKGEEVLEADLRDTSLILTLLRKYGVEPPLRTQGWIKENLYRIFPGKDGRWNYSYYGRHQSTVFGEYVNKLVEAVIEAGESNKVA